MPDGAQTAGREGLLQTDRAVPDRNAPYTLRKIKGCFSYKRQEGGKAEVSGCRGQQPWESSWYIHYRSKAYSPHCLCALTDEPRTNHHIPHRRQPHQVVEEKSRRYRDTGDTCSCPFQREATVCGSQPQTYPVVGRQPYIGIGGSQGRGSTTQEPLLCQGDKIHPPCLCRQYTHTQACSHV